MGEDEGILNFCRVKHLEKFQEENTWWKVKQAGPSAPWLLLGSFTFSWVLACFFSSFQWPKDKFKFLISSREPGERQQAPNTGNHVERISYLLRFPYYFPSPSLRPHLQPHCVFQLFPAAENRRQFTSAPWGLREPWGSLKSGLVKPHPPVVVWLNGKPLSFPSPKRFLGRSSVQGQILGGCKSQKRKVGPWIIFSCLDVNQAALK